MFYRLTPELALRSPWRPHLPRAAERVVVLRTSGVFPPAHPTTRLCLDLLAAAMASGSRPRRVLDVGCGSGVLLLAAAALGAELCLGADLSRNAVLRSRDNARANALTGAVRLVQGSTEALRGSFDLILANLPAPVQRDKVGELSRLAAPGATLILSGFKDLQEGELLAGYRERGWAVRRRVARDEWVIELPPDRSYTWVGWLLQVN